MSVPAFATPVPVRWSDIDMYQHINHATMVTILEEARVAAVHIKKQRLQRLSSSQRGYPQRWMR